MSSHHTAQLRRIVDHYDMRGEIHTNDAELAATMADIARRALNHSALSTLRQAIIDNTKGDLFWIGEILLSELEKETGFNGASATNSADAASCSHCKNYVGKCPHCHSKRPQPIARTS